MQRLLITLAVAAAAAVLPAAAGAELVDHIAAAVNNDVITASELAQTMELNERLGTSGIRATAPETLERIIKRRLLVQEARRLRFVEVSAEEKDAEVAKIRARFGSEEAFSAFLKSLDMTVQELGTMLEERLLVEKFVEKKVGLYVRVPRAEAEAYFGEHAAQYPGRRFPDVQKEIIALLTDRKIGEELGRYVAELRGKADIRINPGMPVAVEAP